MALRINIAEKDVTREVRVLSDTDIVFVPGLSSAEAGDNVAKQFQPILCSTFAEFVAAFGAAPYSFEEGLAYPTTGNYTFSTDAVPSGTKFIPENGIDPSWLYAAMLINKGMRVVYCRLNDFSSDVTFDTIYSGLKTLFGSDSILYSKGDFNFKYITSGAYPVYENAATIYNDMLALAANRGDCIALIDHTDNPNRPLIDAGSVFNSITTNTFSPDGSYGAMFTPWGIYPQNVISDPAHGEVLLPGSYAYLSTLANSLRTNANWLAVGGVSRGVVPEIIALHTGSEVLTNAVADMYQNYSISGANNPIQINAVTNIAGYGLCIWGNRTLRNNVGVRQAMSYLNIRNLVCDIKKQTYTACINLLFEQNTATLWTNFKSYLTPLLDRMVSGSGISAYRIIRNTTDEPTKVSATLRIFPVYSVESFDIDVFMTDDDVTIA